MTEHICDNEGRITAYIEYSLVNKQGLLDDNGTYVFVRSLWIWNGIKNGYQIMQGFIKKIANEFPKATHTYWENKKHNGRIKTISRETALKGII